MDVFKKIKLVPTCLKENLEKQKRLNESIEFEKKIIKNKLEKANNLKNYNKNDFALSGENNQNQDSAKNDNENLNPINNQNPNSNSTKKTYPELVNVIQNNKDVKTLKGLAYGPEGELTAILTYLYQHYILDSNYEEIKNALEEISTAEMKHYELLSEAIVEFGGNPTLTDGMGNVWTGRNISKESNVEQILKDNIKAEQNAIKQYLFAAKTTSNISLAELYLRIIEDEQQHIKLYEELLSKIKG